MTTSRLDPLIHVKSLKAGNMQGELARSLLHLAALDERVSGMEAKLRTTDGIGGDAAMHQLVEAAVLRQRQELKRTRDEAVCARTSVDKTRKDQNRMLCELRALERVQENRHEEVRRTARVQEQRESDELSLMMLKRS